MEQSGDIFGGVRGVWWEGQGKPYENQLVELGMELTSGRINCEVISRQSGINNLELTSLRQ
jgi:hypothetical protein